MQRERIPTPEVDNATDEDFFTSFSQCSRIILDPRTINQLHLLQKEVEQSLKDHSTEILSGYQNFFRKLLEPYPFSIEIKNAKYVELQFQQPIGRWIVRYNGLGTLVFLLYSACLSCQQKCPRIREKKYERICLVNQNYIASTVEEFSDTDIDFIAKVYYLFKYQFPPNEENKPKKIPFCQRKDNKNL